MSDAPRSVAPVVGVLVGVPILAFGVWGTFSSRSDTHPFELARWVVASDLAHDLVAAPIFVTLAWLVGRWLPPPARGPVRWALATTAVLALIAWPFVRGYGRNPTVPSLLNRNYATGLAAYVGVVWAIAGVWLVVAVVRSRNAASPRVEGEVTRPGA